ncbi:type I-C CRISPR-associated endonuclease Cas1c [Treponema brennaborense]|uniref:CRISPR-associated endonuclease Cas1 n=1 Tax=Treponema brennaborense (strain DSM 12168 / CIP 105900 / DD5/3) TaxID=906968 RepID=F4LKN2_TREBD|nr:type I-C CRISPR-associated endonuclease Cas1c [Treponema brennaborense]AEE17588.1 CRISPR-associated protein Cas1 [Treponema brennaborense DSM 12168]
MKRFLNTLYVTTPKTYLRKKGETVAVIREKQTIARIPLITLDGIVCYGNVLVSPFLLGACPEYNISVSFLGMSGEFLARSQGPVAGNVLLRKEQYRISDSEERSANLAKFFLIGKIGNQRTVLQRALRDHSDKMDTERVQAVVRFLESAVPQLERETDLDTIRGIEGDAARRYFSVFDQLILSSDPGFAFEDRNRRPPRDPVNALLSYTYTLLYHDMRSALECSGLDPAVGFLHRDRPGRLSLALDLMEEFRPFFADRLVLSLINKKIITASDFETTASGAVLMNDAARKNLIQAYQKRKEGVVMHPYVAKKMHIAILFQVQAQLLARYIRGDIDGYPVYLWR